eukprot:m.233531 g.233531  ORF g.233531 m.233531 type:complete len:871 (+) comp19192_c0_seq1:27-2639(+)
MEDDDLYGGYNDYDAELDDAGLEDDEAFQQAVKTSYGNRPRTGKFGAAARVGTAGRGGRVGTAVGARLGTGMRVGTAAMRMGTAGRLGTAAAGGEGGDKRPMTAVKAAGFQSSKSAGNAAFDPMQAGRAAVPPIEKAPEDSPEDTIKAMEKKTHAILEESAHALALGDTQKAIDKAKEAEMHERLLSKQREQLLGADQTNFDLTYAIQLHLASVYERCGLDSDAIASYNAIIKNKTFDKAGRLRVNLGNIYFRQREYFKAVKQYRMALDQIPTTHQALRNRLLRNIGHGLFALGQYSDAAKSYEHLLDQTPVRELGGQEVKQPSKDFPAAFNMMLCYYAMGDRDKMKKGFVRLLGLRTGIPDNDERYLNLQNDPQVQLLLDVLKGDALRLRETEDRARADRFILLSAKLISPVVETTYWAGCDWCIDAALHTSHAHLAPELDISKAIMHLRAKDFAKAAEILKTFEKKESGLLSTAASNLSFLFFLEGQYGPANKYADIALTADRYNPNALVNKGNCLFKNNELGSACEYYKEALGIEASCAAALFNLGLAYKAQRLYDDALDCFLKLHAILQHNAEVLYHIAHLYELQGDITQACDWYSSLQTIVPNDPAIYSTLGQLYEKDNDKSLAFQNFLESYRLNPNDIATITWMGAYYIESHFFEKAIEFFQRAALVQPAEVKWRLMIASCYRRVGNYPQAKETYTAIHEEFPENIECLKFLVRLCTDMGLASDVQKFAEKLKRAEKAKEAKEKRETSARTGSGRGRVRAGRTHSGSSHREPSAARELSASGREDSAVRRSRDGLVSASLDATLRGTADRDPLNETTRLNQQQQQDVVFHDPVGDLPQRPKTAARGAREEEEWNEELGDDLLPE